MITSPPRTVAQGLPGIQVVLGDRVSRRLTTLPADKAQEAMRNISHCVAQNYLGLMDRRKSPLHHTMLDEGLFGKESIAVSPCELRDAQRIVQSFHRHHGRVAGHKFSLMAHAHGHLSRMEIGAAIVGRPVSRHLDDGKTLEITRLATSAYPNVASMLLAAAARTARAKGYARLITYTLAEESGTSLRAAGFTPDRKTEGGSWNSPSRPRQDKHPTGPKTRWFKRL